jgi:hypothetical protein
MKGLKHSIVNLAMIDQFVIGTCLAFGGLLSGVFMLSFVGVSVALFSLAWYFLVEDYILD